jgi:hypothetical protein
LTLGLLPDFLIWPDIEVSHKKTLSVCMLEDYTRAFHHIKTYSKLFKKSRGSGSRGAT